MIVLCNIYLLFEGNGLLHKFAYLGYCGNHRTVCDLYKKFGMQNKTARLGEFLPIFLRKYEHVNEAEKNTADPYQECKKLCYPKQVIRSKPKSRVTKVNPGYKC